MRERALAPKRHLLFGDDAPGLRPPVMGRGLCNPSFFLPLHTMSSHSPRRVLAALSNVPPIKGGASDIDDVWMASEVPRMKASAPPLS